MTQIDLTIAVTAHDETVVAGPSMRSAEIAASLAEETGFVVERLIGLDAATRNCREFFNQPRFGAWTILEFQFADPYPTRNALADIAAGKWIAYIDADDLISSNWLSDAATILRAAERARERVIVHPEINWGFDGASSVFTNPPQDDDIFLPYYWYYANYYDMMCVAPREAHLSIPYVHRDLAGGFGYADWQWGIETMAAGWRHVVAKDTIIFKRRRDSSVVRQNAARRTTIMKLEVMSVDRILQLGR